MEPVEPVAVVVVDRTGTIRWWSTGAELLFGHTMSAAVGSTLDLIVPAALRDRHWVGFRRAWSEGIDDATRVARIPVCCADDETRLFPGRFHAIRGPYGDLALLMGVFEPPSDRDEGLFVLG